MLACVFTVEGSPTGTDPFRLSIADIARVISWEIRPMMMNAGQREDGAASRGRVEVQRSVVVHADIDVVWARVTTEEGINHELRPALTMTMPGRYRGASLTEVPVHQQLGKAWLRLGGVLPVEYDDLYLIEVDAPFRFHERSSMAIARVWEHLRELHPVDGGGTRVTDTLALEPRVPLPTVVLRFVVGALFDHRHQRLRRYFGG